MKAAPLLIVYLYLLPFYFCLPRSGLPIIAPNSKPLESTSPEDFRRTYARARACECLRQKNSSTGRTDGNQKEQAGSEEGRVEVGEKGRGGEEGREVRGREVGRQEGRGEAYGAAARARRARVADARAARREAWA